MMPSFWLEIWVARELFPELAKVRNRCAQVHSLFYYEHLLRPPAAPENCEQLSLPHQHSHTQASDWRSLVTCLHLGAKEAGRVSFLAST